MFASPPTTENTARWDAPSLCPGREAELRRLTKGPGSREQREWGTCTRPVVQTPRDRGSELGSCFHRDWLPLFTRRMCALLLFPRSPAQHPVSVPGSEPGLRPQGPAPEPAPAMASGASRPRGKEANPPQGSCALGREMKLHTPSFISGVLFSFIF